MSEIESSDIVAVPTKRDGAVFSGSQLRTGLVLVGDRVTQPQSSAHTAPSRLAAEDPEFLKSHLEA